MTVRQVALVAGAGLVGAALLPYREPGLAAVVTTAMVGGVIVAARRGAGGAPGDVTGAVGVDTTGVTGGAGEDRGEVEQVRDEAVWRWVFALLAGGLALQPALTDAGWVLLLTFPASAGLVVLAAGGGRTWRGTVAPAFRALAMAGTGIGASARAVQAAAPERSHAARHLATGGLTIGLLAVFGALFRSADPTFGRLVDALVPEVSVGGVLLRPILAVVVAVATLGVVRLHPDRRDDGVRPPTVVLTGSQWVVPLASLVVLFSAFVVVQAGVLFGGDRFVQDTPGLTYADHAREGFGQLLVVAVLTLLVIAAASRYAPTASASQERVRRGLFAALCGLTLVVLASALHRLSLYDAAFGLTRDRATAYATILWLAGLFVLVLALGGTRRTDHLPRAAVAWTAVALLAFALVRPDVLVARSNIERFEATGELDHGMLWTLSDDAVPTIVAGLRPDEAACVVPERERSDDPLAWNLARSRAEAARATLTADCRLDVADHGRARRSDGW